MNEKPRIIYMGTPEFAVPTLELLIEKKYNVVAVVTIPDKKQGRGQKETYSPVKECALKNNIPLLQPEKLKDPEFITEIASYKADLQIVVAFRMLPEIIWKMPKMGTFNLHGSLLPNYRGAAPINWAIINGEEETGVTTFFLKHEIDTGDIILQDRQTIEENENIGDIYTKLMHKGAHLVIETLELIERGEVKRLPQLVDENNIQLAPKLFKEMLEIDWQKSDTEIHNFVRGLSPYPCAWTTLMDHNCKIYRTLLLENQPESNETIITDNKKYLYHKTGNGYISIEELQLHGKKRMKITDFLNGNKF